MNPNKIPQKCLVITTRWLRLLRRYVVIAISVSLFSSMSIADTSVGCVSIYDVPNPLCIPDMVDQTTCIKWIHDPAPQRCKGAANRFECFEYSTNGTLDTYTHPNSTGDCSCSSNGWVHDAGPLPSPVNRAYHNDTECAG